MSNTTHQRGVIPVPTTQAPQNNQIDPFDTVNEPIQQPAQAAPQAEPDFIQPPTSHIHQHAPQQEAPQPPPFQQNAPLLQGSFAPPPAHPQPQPAPVQEETVQAYAEPVRHEPVYAAPQQAQPAPAPEIAVKVNPLMQKLRIPGETFRLPSQGLFYTNGELADDVTNGEIYVLPMTTHDEILVKTPDMLLSGKAISEVFSRCIPQVKKPFELLSKDVDYLLTCLRVISYGPTITLSYNHGCQGIDGQDSKNLTYEVSLADLMRQAKSIDPTTLHEKFVVTLENGQQIRLKPTVFSTVLKLNQNMSTSNMDDDEPTEDMLRQLHEDMLEILIEMIQEVDGITDKDMIVEWVNSLPAGWVRFLSASIDDVSDWGVEFVATTNCKECGNEMRMPFSANPVSFFS